MMATRLCPKTPTRPDSGHPFVLDHDGAVHDDALDATRWERWLRIGTLLRHSARVEHDEIRGESLADVSSIAQSENVGRQPVIRWTASGNENSDASRT